MRQASGTWACFWRSMEGGKSAIQAIGKTQCMWIGCVWGEGAGEVVVRVGMGGDGVQPWSHGLANVKASSFTTVLQ